MDYQRQLNYKVVTISITPQPSLSTIRLLPGFPIASENCCPSIEDLRCHKSLLEVSDAGQFRLSLASVKYLMVSRSLLGVRFVSSTYTRLPILELERPPSLSRSRAAMDSRLIQHYSPLIEDEFEHALGHALEADLKSKKR